MRVEAIGAVPTLHSSRAVESAAAQVEILRRVVEVIGSEAEAMRWMGTPVRALDYATPISLLHDAAGYEAVRIILGRLEHGVL
jgi:putative toxin-antitoxin system antitoxin component (TIGR02293 family)